MMCAQIRLFICVNGCVCVLFYVLFICVLWVFVITANDIHYHFSWRWWDWNLDGYKSLVSQWIHNSFFDMSRNFCTSLEGQTIPRHKQIYCCYHNKCFRKNYVSIQCLILKFKFNYIFNHSLNVIAWNVLP